MNPIMLRLQQAVVHWIAANSSYVGREVVIANLEDFGKDDTVTFTISNAEAPSDIGVDAFVVKSAGSRDGRLTELGGGRKATG